VKPVFRRARVSPPNSATSRNRKPTNEDDAHLRSPKSLACDL
jgi:hypothetical protein